MNLKSESKSESESESESLIFKIEMGSGEKAVTLQKLHDNKSRTNAHNVLEGTDVQLLVAKCEYRQPLNTHSTKI
jgi:hypothetical protein